VLLPNYVLDETGVAMLEEADVNSTDFIFAEADTTSAPAAPTGLLVVTHV